MKKAKSLETIYYDPADAGGFGGIVPLSKASKTSTVKETQKWLRTQPTYSLHRPFRKRFPTRKYQTGGPNDLWQMDLMEMIPYARINKGYKYILTCIDVFSRYARAQPIKNKSGEDVCKAIKKMLVDVRPRYIQTDLGKEFYNKHVQSLFEKHKIQHYTVYSQFKAAVVERFNRTLREKLNRYFTHKGNKTWYTVLPTIIETYNYNKHRGINQRRPVDVNNGKDVYDVWEEQEHKAFQRSNKGAATLPLMTYVRISRIAKGPFNKNFDQNWSEEVFRVIACDDKVKPTMYVIQDLNDNIVQGKFYRDELQDIGPTPPSVFRIERILRTKGKGKTKQYFVKWHGYDSTYNSWISAISIQK
jgi:transposase InsO family protein